MQYMMTRLTSDHQLRTRHSLLEAVLQEARRAVDAALEGLLLCRGGVATLAPPFCATVGLTRVRLRNRATASLANLARSTSPLSEVSPSAPFCFHFALKRE